MQHFKCNLLTFSQYLSTGAIISTACFFYWLVISFSFQLSVDHFFSQFTIYQLYSMFHNSVYTVSTKNQTPRYFLYYLKHNTAWTQKQQHLEISVPHPCYKYNSIKYQNQWTKANLPPLRFTYCFAKQHLGLLK